MSVEATPPFDSRLLTRWLGPDGARAGLEKSKELTLDQLRKEADRLGINLPKSATRQHLIDEIVRVANRRITSSAEELMKLSLERIVEYLDSVEPDREELLDLLKQIDAAPSKESRKGLIHFAARELSETGRFLRIASSGAELRRTEPDEKKGGAQEKDVTTRKESEPPGKR
jgi:hypothetical protein